VYIQLELFRDSARLDSFFSLLGRDPIAFKLASPEELIMLKGLPYASLCYLLKYALSLPGRKKIKTITLEACPSCVSNRYTDPEKLFNYYKILLLLSI